MLFSGRRIPDATASCHQGGDDSLPVGAERRSVHYAAVAGELAQLLAGRRIPDASRLSPPAVAICFPSGLYAAVMACARCSR